MEEDITFFLHLHKLDGINKDIIETILSTLWKTRKTGLSTPDKSHLQSLLHLPSTSELYPVVACLRSLTRKCAQESYSEEGLLKLFPSDLGSDLQSNIVSVLNEYQSQWREELSQEQISLPCTSLSCQPRTCNLPTFTNFTSTETPIPTYQDDPSFDFRRCNFGPSTPGLADCNGSSFSPTSLQNDSGTLEQLLHDHSKTPLLEKEVKFQLTIDTLEAMLRSMTYINEKLSSMVGTSLGPSQKKQKQ